jgi:hypothetical protein
MQRDYLQFNQEGLDGAEGAFINPTTGVVEYTIVRFDLFVQACLCVLTSNQLARNGVGSQLRSTGRISAEPHLRPLSAVPPGPGCMCQTCWGVHARNVCQAACERGERGPQQVNPASSELAL